MKRILITGGAGFIGSHLCEALLKKGHEVLCLDNFFTGLKSNLTHIIPNRKFEIIRHDVTASYNIECDEIYNLACPASPFHYQRFPVQTFNTSVQGMIHALDLAKRLKIKVLQASTSEVYGDPTIHPQTETYWGNVNPIGIRSCYDEGKRAAETVCMDYRRQYGIEVKIARIFNTYGPHMAVNDGRVVSNFILQALKGNDITIYGEGTQTRSFQYVDDLIDALIKLMNTDKDFTGPINIGNPKEFSMIELAEKILKMTGSKSKIIFLPLPADDPVQRKPDISKAIAYLGWTPLVDLQEGLTLTINYFKKLWDE